MNDRDDAIRKGIVFGGKKYEVSGDGMPALSSEIV